MSEIDENQYSQIFETVQNVQKIQEMVHKFFASNMTIGELEKELEKIIGPELAELAAITEVTRAASKREQETARLLKDKTGVEMVPIWNTNNDDLVCEVCKSKNGKPIVDNRFPPEHLGCRCWVNYELPEIG